MIENFKFTHLLFELEVANTLQLPEYKGSTFRGAFGHYFKKVVCTLRHKDCNDCLLKERCIYSYIFETPLPSSQPVLRKYKTAPHPFIILPPLEDNKVFDKGESISFNLTLIGKATDYLPYFIYTFNELGNSGIGKANGTFHLRRVLRFNGQDDETIYEGDGKIKKSAYEAMSWQDVVDSCPGSGKIKTLTLHFLTPTRIRQQNDLVVDLDFSTFIRSLLRRIDALSCFHCGSSLDADIKGLIQQSESIKTEKRLLSWYDWERYSNRQETRMKLGGFVGDITFAGDLGPFMPYILLGEYMHVGKNTSFGLGKYEIGS